MTSISNLLEQINDTKADIKGHTYELITLLANEPALATASSAICIAGVIVIASGKRFLSSDETLLSQAIRKACSIATIGALTAFISTSVVISIVVADGLQSPLIDNEVLLMLIDNAITYLSGGIAYGIGIGACAFYLLKRIIEPFFASAIEAFSIKFNKEYLFPEFKNLTKILPKNRRASLKQALKKAKKNNLIILGIDANGKSVSISLANATKPNYQILGETGSGKGVFLSLLCSQLVSYEIACILFCPKRDDHLASALSGACLKENKLFVRVNLSAHHAVINPLFAVTERELFLLIKMTFELQSSGEGIGYYVLLEREFAQLVSEYANVAENISLFGLYEYAITRSSEISKDALGLLIKIKEIATLPSTQTYDDAHLVEIFEKGGCLLIEGNTEDESVLVLMRMLIHRVCQLTVNRKDKTIKVCIVLDEAKYCLTTSVTNYLGNIRSANGCFYFAHQSNADFESVQLRMPPTAVRETCLDNLTKRIVYKTTNFATAKYISELSGTKLVRSDLVNTVSNELAAETQSLERKTSKVEVPNIHTNIVQNLPPFCAISVGILPEPTYMYVPIIESNVVDVDYYIAAPFADCEKASEEDLL
jgi:hypothetical protein